MLEWPMYVYVAADAMGYDYDEASGLANIEAFATRWGGFTSEALMRAIRAAEGEDWLFAMQLLSRAAMPQAREEAVSHLSDLDPLVRWYGALYLGVLRDQRAVPALCTMLTEFLPPAERYYIVRQEQWRYEDQRSRVASLLGTMGDPIAIPALHGALQAVVSIEVALNSSSSTIPTSEHWIFQSALTALRYYQDTIVYALGRLGAVGVLTGLQGADEHIDMWRIHLLIGYLHRRYPIGDIFSFEEKPLLAAKLRQLVSRIYGLDPLEQERHLASYERTMLSKVVDLHAAEAREQAWRVTSQYSM